MKNLILVTLIALLSIVSNAAGPNLSVAKGLIIDKVEAGSPYEKVGLKPGDEVISYDRTPLKSAKDGMDFYNNAKLGKVRVMLIVRDGVRQNLHVKK